MAYPFVDVLGGGLTVEDWFKNQCMHIGTQKSALRLLSIVKNQFHKYEKMMNSEVLKKMKRLEAKLTSKGKSLLTQEFIENLDLEDYGTAVWKEEPSKADLLKMRHAEESRSFDIDKLVDENNRRFSMQEFNDIYEDMQVQEAFGQNPTNPAAQKRLAATQQTATKDPQAKRLIGTIQRDKEALIKQIQNLRKMKDPNTQRMYSDNNLRKISDIGELTNILASLGQ